MNQNNRKEMRRNDESKRTKPSASKPRKRKYKTKAEKLEANRKSAADSRHRKKAVLMRLQQEVISLRRERSLLLLENAALKKQMSLSHAQNTLQSIDPISLSPSLITTTRSALDKMSTPTHSLQRNFKHLRTIAPRVASPINNQSAEEHLIALRLKVSKYGEGHVHVYNPTI